MYRALCSTAIPLLGVTPSTSLSETGHIKLGLVNNDNKDEVVTNKSTTNPYCVSGRYKRSKTFKLNVWKEDDGDMVEEQGYLSSGLNLGSDQFLDSGQGQNLNLT
ncbi:hypothetical protein BS47DRAFT_1367492 [Hydnum rufescens UP504]|uniref:Uncharacterized protein n=1 Tax=Hydnum rufescens UP504 TaxID=1448309 RepID=A0A9P6AJ17_9AGAM|nr:hypothetical protein BS47DRAFT_1367492 [Hydnum rufescens UP504]